MSKRRRRHDRRFPSPGLILPNQRLWTPDDGLRKPSPFARNLMGPLIRRGCCGDPVGGGCARCIDQLTATPLNITAVVAGIANGTCSDCGDLNDTYELTQTGSYCRWRYDFGDSSPCSLALTGFGGLHIFSVQLQDYGGALSWIGYFGSPGGNYRWRAVASSDPEDCMSVSSLVLTPLTTPSLCDLSSSTITISV